ncbi:MAG: radical SAM protein [Desulfuromonadaceae bacterium]|nr:radical SAM protein [Desulfuromonadaceae bacterium]
MAKILFIESDLRNEKLGIMYLSAALKKAGHDTQMCWVEREDIHDLMPSYAPDFIAFSLTTGAHKSLLALAAELKQKYPVKVVVGGPHATFFAEEIPEEAADYVVIGQGEKALVDIVGQSVQQRVISYDLNDLNEMAFPDRELFYRFTEFRDNPMKNVITCRDCPYSCSYCYNHTWKEKFRGQPHFLQRRCVDNVLAELSEIKKRYLVEQFLFIDDNFLFNRDWVKEFCLRYPVEIGLPFLCSFSLNLFDEEVLTDLKNAGLFMVNFALESADPVVQREILNRGHVKNEHIEKGIKLLQSYGIKTRMQNMIGLPVRNSLEDALNTLAFNQKNKVDDSWASIFQPYPNTKLAAYCAEKGFSDPGNTTCADSFFDKSCLDIDHPDEIKRLQKWWYFIIKNDIPEAVVKNILLLDFDEQVGNELQNLRYSFSRNYLYGLNDLNQQLEHNWERIRTDFSRHKNFNVFKKLIRQYALCYGLVEIFMKIKIPPSFTLKGM